MIPTTFRIPRPGAGKVNTLPAGCTSRGVKATRKRCCAGFVAGVLLGGFLSAEAIAGPPSPLPDTAACPLARPQTRVAGRVVRVPDGRTLTLASGRTVRLVSALVPQPLPWQAHAHKPRASAPLSERAREILRELALGKQVFLVQTGRRHDRYGHILAHVLVRTQDGLRWLQGELVRRGLARVYSFADNRACIRPLLRMEQAARTTRRGLWHSRGLFAIRPAANPQALYRHINRFVIIAGRVQKVGRSRKNIYLNFGTDWRTDFTAMIAKRHQRRFVRAGITLGELAGQKIRLRGWLESWNGPLLRLTHPEQMEILTGSEATMPAVDVDNVDMDALLPDLPKREPR